MKRIIFGTGFFLTSFLFAQEEAEIIEEVLVEEAAEDPEWEKLKTAAAAYVKSFNDKDADAIAALYADEGEILLTEDAKVVGRDAIAQHYARVFDNNPNAEVGLEATSVTYVTPTLVLEEGTVYFTEDDETVSTHNYATINEKGDDGKWRIKQSRSREVEESVANDELDEISGVIGDWVALIGEGKYKVNYRWDPSGAWIIGKGRYIAPDIEPITSTVRIGWDESLKQIVSWSFDSLGGHSRSTWSMVDGTWTMKAQGVNASGETTRSSQTVEVSNAENVTWKFSDRSVGGEAADDFEMRLVKTPPKPFVTPEPQSN
jgi:uncharacterized protein (TIGR02246 family)